MSITKKLCEFLGEPLVAYITNTDHRTVEDWHDGRNVPDSDQLETIVFSWYLLQDITEATCENTAKAWFTKENESLFGRTPADAIRDNKRYDTQVAAILFIEE